MLDNFHKTHFDLFIVGAGVTGLLLASKAPLLGLRTALIEREHLLATGPSTRNEGWLHHGTYHATSIKSETEAIAVAERCMYGHRQLRAYAPEAVENPRSRSFALVRTAAMREHALQRWMMAGVPFREITIDNLRQLDPSVRLDDVAAVFEVTDVSIDTRMLYRKLLSQAIQGGATIMRDTELQSVEGSHLVLGSGGEATLVTSKVVVYTTGFGLQALFKALYNKTLNTRYWKSHLLVAHRLSEHAVFFLEPGEAAMMHHADKSIIGLNEDAMLCANPDFEVCPENVQRLRDAISRLVQAPPDNWSATACIKVDMKDHDVTQDTSRSLNIVYREELPGHFWVLPGKMTEAPYVADEMLRLVAKRIPDECIASRPCDLAYLGERT